MTTTATTATITLYVDPNCVGLAYCYDEPDGYCQSGGAGPDRDNMRGHYIGSDEYEADLAAALAAISAHREGLARQGQADCGPVWLVDVRDPAAASRLLDALPTEPAEPAPPVMAVIDLFVERDWSGLSYSLTYADDDADAVASHLWHTGCAGPDREDVDGYEGSPEFDADVAAALYAIHGAAVDERQFRTAISDWETVWRVEVPEDDAAAITRRLDQLGP